jgi:hypothetical protein
VKQDDAGSMAEWLCTHLALSIKAGRSMVEVARALEELPAIAAAYEAGKLSSDKVAALVHLAPLAHEAQGLNAAQIELAARKQRPITREEDNEGHRRGSLWWLWSDDSSFLRPYRPATARSGAIVSAALERVAEQVPATPDRTFLRAHAPD